MELNLDYLKGLEVAPGEKATKRTAVISKPVKGDILIKSNGFIAVSDKLIEALDGNWADIVFLTEWKEVTVKEGQEGLFFVIVPKESAKASIKKTGTKLSFIRNEFIPNLLIKMDIDLEELKSIEFGIAWDKGITNENGIYHFEKITSSGASKGQIVPQRRENVTLLPMAVILPESNEEDINMGDQQEVNLQDNDQKEHGTTEAKDETENQITD